MPSRRPAESEEDSATLAKEERACIREGKLDEATQLQAKRLGLGGMFKGTRIHIDGAIKKLKKMDDWPASAQWLHKSDVGAIMAAWRKLTPVLLHEPDQVGSILALVERVTAIFATWRAIKSKVDPGVTHDELVDACERGAFLKLLNLAESMNKQHRSNGPRRWTEAERKLRKAQTAAKQTTNPGGISAAMMVLESKGCAPATMATFDTLVALTPKARRKIDEDVAKDLASAKHELAQLDLALVRRCIKGAPRGKTKDLAGLRFEHLQTCLSIGGPFANGFLTLLLEQTMRHPEMVGYAIVKARSVGISKKDDSIRPIGITSVFRRIWAKLIIREHGKVFEKILSHRHKQTCQLAVGVKGGAMKAGIFANVLRDANPEHVHVQLDVKNAFNTVDRTRMIKALLSLPTDTKEGKAARSALASFVDAVYARGETPLTFYTDDGPQKLECSTGVTQGCGMGTLLFALTFQDIICTILEEDEHKSRREFERVFVTAYADDGVVSGPPDQALAFAKALGTRCDDEAALEIKEHLVFVQGDANFQEISLIGSELKGFKIEKEGIVFAGNPIGSFEFVNNEVATRVRKNEARLAAIREFAQTKDEATSRFKGAYKHIALALVSYCCDRRLDDVLQVTPYTWINTNLLTEASADIWKTIESISMTTRLVLLLLDLILCPAGSSVSPSPRCVH
jgi:hypothetical protein